MRKENLKFKTNDGFIKDCIFNPSIFNEKYDNFLKEVLQTAENTEEFINLFLANKDFKKTQGYQELLKYERPEQAWYFVRENFSEKCLKLNSDAGGVKVGNDDFSIIIPNGYGDGITRVAIFENNDFYCDNLMTYFTLIKCERCHIYDYDCGGLPQVELNGYYSIYFYDGLVAFVKC